MSEEFTPITSQEQFQEAIQSRLDRQAKKFEGYTSPDDLAKIKADYDKQIADLTKASESAAKKYADYDKQLSERDSKIKSYETASVKTRIAHEVGLPYGMASRLSGESEDDIRKDAEALVKLLDATGKRTAPLASAEAPVDKDPKQAALRSLAKQLHGGN